MATTIAEYALLVKDIAPRTPSSHRPDASPGRNRPAPRPWFVLAIVERSEVLTVMDDEQRHNPLKEFALVPLTSDTDYDAFQPGYEVAL